VPELELLLEELELLELDEDDELELLDELEDDEDEELDDELEDELELPESCTRALLLVTEPAELETTTV